MHRAGRLSHGRNVGGCVVRLGATEACGKAIDQVSTCLIVGCAGCTTRKEQDACGDALTTVDGACAAPFPLRFARLTAIGRSIRLALTQ